MVEWQDMGKGALYTIATPIGNLGDITIRALDVLRTVDVIACEDTRETHKLLHHYEITNKQLLSYHAQSRQSKEDEIIQLLRSGKTVALISDRGTPGISDPGSRLIHAVADNDIVIVPIPGACAIITALQAAGVDTSAFVYVGFLPHKKGRQTLLSEIAAQTRTVVFYESPHRLLKALEVLSHSQRRVVVARELTKVHEEFVRGSAQEVYDMFKQREAILGECVVIVHSV